MGRHPPDLTAMAAELTVQERCDVEGDVPGLSNRTTGSTGHGLAADQGAVWQDLERLKAKMNRCGTCRCASSTEARPSPSTVPS